MALASRKKAASALRLTDRAGDTVYGALTGDAEGTASADVDVAVRACSGTDRAPLRAGVYAGGPGEAGLLGASLPALAYAFDGRVADVGRAAPFAVV